MTTTIEESVDIQVPAATAYNQWTQFETFPQFMSGVKEVKQLDDRRLRWRAEVGGKMEEWEAEITEQIPDKRIAWRSVGGARNAGVVTFHHLAKDRSRVMLQIEYEPQGVLEKVGDLVGTTRGRIAKDLAGFKRFLEDRGVETGAWRGEIRH